MPMLYENTFTETNLCEMWIKTELKEAYLPTLDDVR